MTDPTPSVSEALVRCDFECPTAALTIRDHIESLQRELAEAESGRMTLRETADRATARADDAESALADARRDAEALRERVELVIASMDYTDASEYAVELRAAIGAPHG